MAHKPYNLHRRSTTKPNKHIYYVQFYDDNGKRLSAISTGQTSKAAAEIWAIEYLKKGFVPVKKHLTFSKYAEDWWIWERCKYIKVRLARGSNISRGYVNTMRTYLVHHILPYFSDRKLQKISADMIENWVMDLRTKLGKNGSLLSPTTINRCLGCLKIMLKEAVSRGLIPSNPALSIGSLKENPKQKSILYPEEVNKLLRESQIQRIWDNDILHYTLNLLAASTGLRMGEALALQRENIFDHYIVIEKSWDRKYGLKEPKWQSQRLIPIPSKTSAYLQKLIEYSPYWRSGGFVFFGNTYDVPASYKQILDKLYRALERIGITAEERKGRNITFHS